MKGPTALAFTLVRWGSHNQIISLFPAAMPSAEGLFIDNFPDSFRAETCLAG